MRSSVTFGSFEFDPYSRLLKRDGVELSLPPRVLGVLEVLLRRAGDVVPRQELIDNVWKDAFVTDTSLAEAVSLLRQALGDDPQSPSFIQTFHRRGYRFVAPVAVQGLPAAAAAEPARDTRVLLPPDEASDGPSIGMELVPWSVAVACAILAVIALAQAVATRDLPLQTITRFAIDPPAGKRFDSRAPAFAIAADGSRVAFSACDFSACELYFRPSNHLDVVALAGTTDAAAPFFSPDGRWIGFFADGHLKKVSVNGGAPVTLADVADPLGAAWMPNGEIVYAGAAPGLRLISEAGESVTLTTPNPQHAEVRHAYPSVVPGTRFLLFTVTTSPELVQGRLALLDLNARSRPPVTLLANAVSAFAPSKDMLAFATPSELQVVGLDVERGRIVGAPQTSLSRLAAVNTAPQFAASPDGTGIALTAEASPPPALLWSDTTITVTGSGRSEIREESVPLDDLRSVVLSPDGRRVAGFNREDAANVDLWIGDLVTRTAARMTHGEVASAAVWNRNGTALWFSASAGGPFAIYHREIESLQPPRRIFGGNYHAFPSSVSPDGWALAITILDPRTGGDIWTIPSGGGAAAELIRTPFEETNGVFSPNGKQLAYQSNEGGRWQVYVHRLSEHRRVSVSTDGGTSPFWSPYGDALYFVSGDRLMRVAVDADGSIVGTPRVLLHRIDARPVGVDFRRKVLFERHATTPARSAVVTLHWDRELRQLLGPPSPALPR